MCLAQSSCSLCYAIILQLISTYQHLSLRTCGTFLEPEVTLSLCGRLEGLNELLYPQEQLHPLTLGGWHGNISATPPPLDWDLSRMVLYSSHIPLGVFDQGTILHVFSFLFSSLLSLLLHG